MNKQGREIDGKVVGGIEWTKTILPNKTERAGYTHNPIAGCQHGCRWKMPDGKIAICYAENVAENLAQTAYPHGFEWHYWKPDILKRPLKVKEPSRIFVGSMTDVFGAWVPDEQIKSVLDVCRKAHWHIFQLLTKNAPRLLKFDFPPNCWIGVSTPPDFMLGNELSQAQKEKMLHRSLDVLAAVDVPVRWISVEPLSWDCAAIFAEHEPLHWAVIGAASNGKIYHQPEKTHVEKLLGYFDYRGIPVFFKGNLKWAPFRENFPLQVT